jgi:hypothetical protein
MIFMHEYRQAGRLYGYRVMRREGGQIAVQRYFFTKEYGTIGTAKKHARRYAKEIYARYQADCPGVFARTGHVIGLCLCKEYRDKYTEPYRTVRLQIRRDGVTFRREWSLNKNEWEAAYEDAVKIIIDFRQIELTHDIAMKFEKAKALYNPYKKSNWRRRR